MKLLWCLILCLYPSLVLAETNDWSKYEKLSREALEMSQYHPDKSRKMHEELALKLEGEVSMLEKVPAHVAYNLGNLWYHAGELGHSMLWYRRAEYFGSSSAMLSHNISIVMKERLDELPDHFRPQWLMYGDEIILLEPALYWVFFISLMILLWSAGKAIRSADPSLKMKILICLTLGILWMSVYALSLQRGDGVVLDSEVIARKGNGLIFSPAFTHPLHEGTEVTFLEQRGNWSYVELSNGQRCWMPNRSLGWVK